MAKRLNVLRRVRLRETWPLPIGVCEHVSENGGEMSADSYSERALESYFVLLDALNGFRKNGSLAVY